MVPVSAAIREGLAIGDITRRADRSTCKNVPVENRRRASPRARTEDSLFRQSAAAGRKGACRQKDKERWEGSTHVEPRVL